MLTNSFPSRNAPNIPKPMRKSLSSPATSRMLLSVQNVWKTLTNKPLIPQLNVQENKSKTLFNTKN